MNFVKQTNQHDEVKHNSEEKHIHTKTKDANKEAKNP